MAIHNYMFFNPQTLFQDISAPDGRAFMDPEKELLDDYLAGSVAIPEFDFGEVELLEDPLHLPLLMPLPSPLPCAEQVMKDEGVVFEADSLSNLHFVPPPPTLLQSREDAQRLVMSQGLAHLGFTEKASGNGGREKGGYLGNSLHAHPLEIEGSALSLRRRIYGTGDIQARDCIKMGLGGGAPLTCDHSSFEEARYKVGRYTVEERKQRIYRYKMKRNERNFNKKIKYACRKTLADSRPRVRGRFARNEVGDNSSRAKQHHVYEDVDEMLKAVGEMYVCGSSGHNYLHGFE
ncbi:two-component response regulator-like APRR9 [Cryptomeria japonica]|uniref:two-component response regulator-like APRR9 n=1 Tax=Cryptomeria japonica TaxID=3369 RepID=UPI0025ACB3FC|nr:two-component response regulator-like APRR9 [Cryptomeria japonica]